MLVSREASLVPLFLPFDLPPSKLIFHGEFKAACSICSDDWTRNYAGTTLGRCNEDISGNHFDR